MPALQEFSTELWGQTSIHKIVSKAMQNGADFKFEAKHLEASQPLQEWACYAVDQYIGSFGLMISLRTQQRLGKQLTPNQLKSALNTLLRCWRASLEETKPAPSEDAALDTPTDFGKVRDARKGALLKELLPDEMNGSSSKRADWEDRPPARKVLQRPHDGTYTFVCGGEYRVIQFDTYKQNGRQYVKFQYGPDNTRHFAKCGVIDKAGYLTLWGSAYYRGDKISLSAHQRADLREAIEYLCGLGAAEQLHAGERYALKAGCCFICGTTLTVPSSISACMGPVCAENWSAHHGL